MYWRSWPRTVPFVWRVNFRNYRRGLQKWLGKRILYAESDVRVTPELLRELAGDADELADVPRLHQIISRGQPLATQIVAAETEQGLRCRLGFDVAAAT